MNFFCCSCVGFHLLSSCLVSRESSFRDTPCFFSSHGRNWSRLSLQPQCGLSPQTWECSTVPCKTPGACLVPKSCPRRNWSALNQQRCSAPIQTLLETQRLQFFMLYAKLQRTALSVVKSRHALGSPGCLSGCSFVGHYAEQ